uniref:Uncharacterized protein n=1 Tax=Ditylenchus dipsaci TaxID=166011 RepID=A0A915D8I1_9BILA
MFHLLQAYFLQIKWSKFLFHLVLTARIPTVRLIKPKTLTEPGVVTAKMHILVIMELLLVMVYIMERLLLTELPLVTVKVLILQQ